MARISRINSEELYKEAQSRLKDLKGAKEGTVEHAEAQQLKAVIADYESDNNITVSGRQSATTGGTRGTKVTGNTPKATGNTTGGTGKTKASRGKKK